MTYVTTGERIGYERGITEGIERERSLVIRQLNRKLGQIPPELESKVQELELTDLEALGESIFDFETVSDLESWLSDR